MDKIEIIVPLMSVLFSGQLVLAVWQIIKEVNDRKRAKQEALNKERSGNEFQIDLIKRIYRTTLKEQLRQIFTELDNLDKYAKPQVMLDLTELKDNMELYIKIGGNGAVHRLYATLLKKLMNDPALVQFIDAAWVDNIGNEIKQDSH